MAINAVPVLLATELKRRVTYLNMTPSVCLVHKDHSMTISP